MTALFNLGINSYNGWKFCSLPLDTLTLKYYQRAFTCIYYIYKRFYATFKMPFIFGYWKEEKVFLLAVQILYSVLPMIRHIISWILIEAYEFVY